MAVGFPNGAPTTPLHCVPSRQRGAEAPNTAIIRPTVSGEHDYRRWARVLYFSLSFFLNASFLALVPYRMLGVTFITEKMTRVQRL